MVLAVTVLFVFVLGFVTVLAVTLLTFCRASVAGFTFFLAVAVVAGLVVAGRVVEVAGLLVVVGLTVRLVADEFAGRVAGLVVELVFAGRVVVVEGLVVVIVGRPCAEGVRFIFCCALW